MSKTILITGANGNLGAATVKKFLDEGYRVIAVDHSNNHLGFAGSNPNFEWKAVDLSEEKTVEEFVADILQRYGRLEGALLLVGGFAMGSVEATGGEELKKM